MFYVLMYYMFPRKMFRIKNIAWNASSDLLSINFIRMNHKLRKNLSENLPPDV